MALHKCSVCDFIYDDKNRPDGINVDFNNLPEEWRCPECGSHKSCFLIINTKKVINENDQ